MLGELLRRMLGRPAAPERRDGLVIGSPTAAYYQGAYFGGAGYLAENLASVCSAVTLISRTIGSLPWLVYQETEQGRIEAPSHPVARLLRRPDGDAGLLTLGDLAEWWIGGALLAGNSICAIIDNGQGQPTQLRPVPWSAANPMVDPRSGQVRFHVATAGDLPWWPAGSTPRVIRAEDCLWLKDRPDANGIFGKSALSRAPQVLATASAAAAFSAQMFTTGAKLSGGLSHPGRLGKEAADRIAQSWVDVHSGPANAGRALVLEEGMKFEAMSMTLEDAELLASRKFETEEIARLFNIPLPILNVWDHSTFTNSDTASQWFAQLCLSSWCRKIEAEFSRVLFNDPAYHLEIDLSALMRGSFATRIQSELNMVRAGVLTPNEMRLAEGWPALPGGDRLMPQSIGGAPGQQGDAIIDSPPSPGGSPRPAASGNGAVH
jgi:HK97 family phage portal protein